MRHISILLFVFLFGSKSMMAQGTVSLGPDHILPTCKACDTLVATSVAPTVGAINYDITQITYSPYPYVGANVIPNANIDDRWTGIVNLPFDFCFYGNVYNQFIVSTNGQVSFNIAQANTGNPWSFAAVTALPNAAFTAAHNSIMCPYHDILPSVGGSGPTTWEVYGTAPNRVMVVSFSQQAMFSCTSTFTTQQIAMYEGTNVIETYIENKPICTGWNVGKAIHGTQNISGTVAHIVPGRNLPTQWSATNDAWRWTPTNAAGPGSPAPVVYEWTNLTTGAIVGGNTDTIIVCPTQTTNYQVKATWNLCGITETATDVIAVIKHDPINIAISNIVDANCFNYADGSYGMSVTGGGAPYAITSNGNPISNGPQTGLLSNYYNIIVTDAYNCTGTTAVFVSQPTELELNLVSQSDVLCKYQNTGTVHVTATGSVPAYQFWHTGGNNQTSPNFDSMRAGNFVFYVTDTHGCLDSMNITVLEPDSLLNVVQVPHIATCFNKNDGSVDAIPSGGIPGYTYEWNTQPMQYGATATGLETGVYHVLVTDANGCITATQIEVEQELCCQLFLPDAFTPNNDNVNDYYKIIERGGGVILGEFRIYNRWGQELYSTRDMNKGWNGEFKGQAQNSDTYTYIVQYQCNDKGKISQKIAKGDFILIR